MTDKVTLTPISTFVNDSSAATAYNNNLATITSGFDQCLFLNGTAPNQMQSQLDMNSNQIINLPAPSSINSPARLQDVVTNPTLTVPPTGTSGATVPLLNTSVTWANTTNQTFAGTTTFSGVATFNAAPSFAGGITLPANSVGSSQIQANAVTNADAAQMPLNTIKGNNTGGTANAADLTVPQVAAMFSSPQVTIYTSGSGTYTTPSNTKYLIVEMVGGGGGSGGNGTASATNGGTGGNSTFGSSFLTANGGVGGNLATGTISSNTAAGGTATGGDINITGKPGQGSTTLTGGTGAGGMGGDSFYGGGGLGANSTPAATAGNAAVGAGSGAGGASGASGVVSGSGGGAAGGWLRKLVTSPAGTYAYTVGSGGTAGTGGTSGAAGAAGSNGLISVTAYFQ